MFASVGGFMKFVIIVLMLTQFAFGETIREKEIKDEMLSRVNTLILKAEEGKTAVKTGNVEPICKVINEFFKILPDHLLAIGTRMNLLNGKVMKMENETKTLLIYTHQKHNICDNDPKQLDLEELDKKFSKMGKMFKDQRRRIEKSDTNYNNIYNYYYEF